MSSRREEKERLRAQRLAAERHEQSSARRRLIAGYVIAGILGAAVLAGLIAVIASGGDGERAAQTGCGENAHVQIESGVTDDLECDEREGATPPPIQFGELQQSAQQAGCELQLKLPDEGNEHFADVAEGDKPSAYKTVPPTSGDHFGAPAENGAGAFADGAYLERPPTARVVHSLEHGRIALHYDPELPEDQQLALKGLFDEDPAAMLLFPDGEAPYASNPPNYAVAATAWQNLVRCPRYNEQMLDVIRNFRDTFRGNGPENVPIHL